MRGEDEEAWDEKRNRESQRHCKDLVEAKQIAARDSNRQSARKQARRIWKSGG